MVTSEDHIHNGTECSCKRRLLDEINSSGNVDWGLSFKNDLFLTRGGGGDTPIWNKYGCTFQFQHYFLEIEKHATQLRLQKKVFHVLCELFLPIRTGMLPSPSPRKGANNIDLMNRLAHIAWFWARIMKFLCSNLPILWPVWLTHVTIILESAKLLGSLLHWFLNLKSSSLWNYGLYRDMETYLLKRPRLRE